MRRISLILLATVCITCLSAQTKVHISDPETWSVSQLQNYIGQTITFDVPMVVCNNYNGLTISPRRTFAPTNQANPAMENYQSVVTNATTGELKLSGAGGYHRMGEKIYNLTVRVNSATSVSYQSGTFRGNTRADLKNGPDMSIIDPHGDCNVLVCAMNLEYYLAVDFPATGTMGPNNASEHARQRVKTIAALSTINADLYGLVEIQQGDDAVSEVTDYLNMEHPERNYRYIHTSTTPNGSYTQSCYVYDAKVLEPVGAMMEVSTAGVSTPHRKRIQRFRELSTGETFYYSINHTKSKSGGSGGPQGAYNTERVHECESVIQKYNSLRASGDENDILIMGDLNAYGMEDPILTLTAAGMTDLHRYFHADSSYSYTFHGQAGYLDHALCSKTMLAQVTGMAAYHINSDEDDGYTYDGYNADATMFRCSDHDPVLVGLKLDKNAKINGVTINAMDILSGHEDILIKNAKPTDAAAYYRLYTTTGWLVSEGEINSNAESVERPQQAGVYILMVYAGGATISAKVMVK